MATGFQLQFSNCTALDAVISVGGFYNTGNVSPLKNVPVGSSPIGPYYYESSTSSYAALTASFDFDQYPNMICNVCVILSPYSGAGVPKGSGLIGASLTPVVIPNVGTIVANLSPNYNGSSWTLGTLSLLRVQGSVPS